MSKYAGFHGIGVLGGGLYYFYKHPFDKEQYQYTLDNPTAYELETLTPKQVRIDRSK